MKSNNLGPVFAFNFNHQILMLLLMGYTYGSSVSKDIVQDPGLSLKKTLNVWLPCAKTRSYCYGMRLYIACHIMACYWHEKEYWLGNNRVRNDDNELRKNLACFQTYGTDV